MDGLKSCPFCGSSATLWHYAESGECIVSCDNDYCGCSYGHNMSLRQHEVAKLWNKRVTKESEAEND